MSWDEKLTKLRAILANLYPLMSESIRLVTEAGLPSDMVAFQPKAVDNWFAILGEANRRGMVLAVIEAALRDYPNNPDLLEAKVRAEVPSQTPVDLAPAPVSRTKLRDILMVHFNQSALEEICFNLGVDYENLPGAEKGGKVRGLIEYFEHRSRYLELVEACRHMRPNAPWRA